jgi:hypothetical protein
MNYEQTHINTGTHLFRFIFKCCKSMFELLHGYWHVNICFRGIPLHWGLFYIQIQHMHSGLVLSSTHFCFIHFLHNTAYYNEINILISYKGLGLSGRLFVGWWTFDSTMRLAVCGISERQYHRIITNDNICLWLNVVKLKQLQWHVQSPCMQIFIIYWPPYNNLGVTGFWQFTIFQNLYNHRKKYPSSVTLITFITANVFHHLELKCYYSDQIKASEICQQFQKYVVVSKIFHRLPSPSK